MSRFLKRAALAALFLIINSAGCGSSSGGEDPVPPSIPFFPTLPSVFYGQFLDSAVQGLEFQTLSQKGVTDKNGTFRYLPGEVITFKIGQIVLGSAPAKSIMTPLDLVASASDVTDQEVTNICRLLQTLDNNDDLFDGIQIAAAIRRAADCSVEFDQSFNDFDDDSCILTVIGTQSLVTAADAQDHLYDTMVCGDMDCNNGRCDDGICECDDGFTGDSCETNINECDPDPCLNGGFCTDGINDFTCYCIGGYTGERCENDPGVVPESISISGTISFDLVPATQSAGLDYGNIEQAPVRMAVLEVIQASNQAVLNTTTTDASGNYTVEVPAASFIFIRVKAQMLQTGSPGWDFQVVDNTNGKALYAMDSVAFNTGVVDINDKDLLAVSGWGGTAYTAPRVAGPFAILDTVYKALNKVLTVNSLEDFPQLKINWSVNNVPSFGDPENGQIGTSYFSPSEEELYILGAEDSDTDEYDDHVIAHEWGHYFEHHLSRSDSLGGNHGMNDRLDPRIAFGEGFGNAFSGIATDDPYYVDTMYTGQGLVGVFFNLSLNSQSPLYKGWYSEASIQTILYRLYDDSFSSLGAPFSPIYYVLTGSQRNADAFTTIFSFISFLKTEYPAFESDINALLSAENITASAVDEWDSTERETNNAGISDTLPIYTKLVQGNPAVVLCGDQSFGNYNKLNNRKFFYFEVITSGSRTITVNPDSDGDPAISLYAQGERIYQADIGYDGEPETLTVQLTPGLYVGEVFDWFHVYGSRPSQECFDVSLN